MSKKSVDNDEGYSVAERLPKQVRIRILKALLEDYYQKSIAEFCEVRQPSVSNWINRKEYWPSTESSVHILRLGLKLKPDETRRIVIEDIDKYLTRMIKRLIPGVTLQFSRSWIPRFSSY